MRDRETWYNHRDTIVAYRAASTAGEPLPTWHEEAACAPEAAEPTMAAAWIADWHPMEAEAVEICESCPVRKLCLTDALNDPMAEGIRGGFRFVQGRMLKDQAPTASKVLGRRIPQTPRYTRNRATNGAQPSSL